MKIYHNPAIFILALFLFLFHTNLVSQPILTGLSGNHQLIMEAQKQTSNSKENIEYENVKLPFFDDFSYNSPYPNPALWLDRQAFVNRTFPIRPPTIGVATLDALNEFGEIYSHATTARFSADTLTSRPIRLDSVFTPKRSLRISDSLYFSFYYQPGGGCEAYPPVPWARIGNNPDQGDHLILEFGYNTGDSVFYDYQYIEMVADADYRQGDSILNPCLFETYFYFDSPVLEGDLFLMPCDSLFKPVYVWHEVWNSERGGHKLDNWLDENRLQYFKQVMIPILSEDYLRHNFQFRFRNYASLETRNMAGWASNVDQWHIDYVMLDMNRRANDVYPNDVAFVSPTTTILKNYQAMPWNQFKQSDLKSSFHNQLSNLSFSEKTTRYGCTVMKNGTEQVGEIRFNSAVADPYHIVGLHENSRDEAALRYHVNPVIDFTSPLNDAADSAYFVITHVFEVEGSGDACRRNDTCIYIQKFYNYYAYDDGTAEAGYSLLSTMSHPDASLALRFDLAEKDTLRAVRMWFNSVLNDANFKPFTLKVWTVGNDGKPGTELYSQEAMMPRHASEYFDFVTYFLDDPFVPREKSFFVGFYQNHPVQLNIGFDQNSYTQGVTYYKTEATWEESYYKGMPMIRPVMGKQFSESAVPEYKENVKITVYPNPTTGQLRIANYETKFGDSQLRMGDIEIFDVLGRKQKAEGRKEKGEGEMVIDISHLPAGIYFLRITTSGAFPETKKIIKR